MGRSFEKENSWNLYFQDVSGRLWFAVYLIGLGIVFYYLFEGVMMLFSLLSKAGETNGKSNRLTDFIFGKHAFIKCMVLILLSYLPVIIICYPGGSCVDVSYQISQAIGRVPFSTLHPILHTLFVGTFVNLGHRIFGSYDLGLYLPVRDSSSSDEFFDKDAFGSEYKKRLCMVSSLHLLFCTDVFEFRNHDH